jgi:hypothetical protein
MKNDGYLIKAPPGMLDLWRQTAERRGITLAQLIREAVNKEIQNDGEDDERESP